MFKFNPEDKPVAPQGVVCMSANLPQHLIIQPLSMIAQIRPIEYHSGNAHIDSATGNQIEFTNVFALYTNISLRGVGALVDVELNGEMGIISLMVLHNRLNGIRTVRTNR